MAKEKQPLTAVQRGKRGALIGMILVEIIMVLMIFVESSNIIEVIGGILIAGFGGALYGFGYAFYGRAVRLFRTAARCGGECAADDCGRH